MILHMKKEGKLEKVIIPSRLIQMLTYKKDGNTTKNRMVQLNRKSYYSIEN